MLRNSIQNIMARDCTGCSACMNICPKSAIEMRYDKEGFIFPKIEEDKCIDCGLCFRICPAKEPKYRNTETSEAYAVMADDSVRMKSSSGGLFTLLATNILEHNGSVAGVVFSNDCMHAEHRLAHSIDELDAMRTSKYIQSEPHYIYQEVKRELEAGKPVLFTGCPCQVAGLYAYLGKKSYDDLYTADLVCHGACSTRAYHKMLEEKANGRKVKAVNFRAKEKYGWNHSLTIEFTDGSTFDENKKVSKWYKGFMWGIINRKSCGDCVYARLPRVGDITMGDLWGTERFAPELNDKKGTSLALVNNQHGKQLLEHIKGVSKKLVPIATADAIANNTQLREPHRLNPNRQYFFDRLDELGFSAAVDEAPRMKHDIGIVGWWYGKNYGSSLTYFGLHEYLKDHGYTVMMYTWPFGNGGNAKNNRFYRVHYEMSPEVHYPDMTRADDRCNNFILGSDQLWNYHCIKDNGWYFMLDFVGDTKRKIAYATSFGHDHSFFPPEEEKKARFYLQRFNSISVREDSGVQICRDVFGVEAVKMIDPAFLCGRRAYERLLPNAKVRFDSPYLLAYILTPSDEKKKALLYLAKRLNLKLKVIVDRQGDKAELIRQLGLEENMLQADQIEDWLYSIKHAEYIVTDSFHGTLFSIVFNKRFVSINNPRRGATRFTSLLSSIHLENHLVPENSSEADILHAITQDINYEEVQVLLDRQIDEAKRWLDTALHQPLPEPTGYDFLLKEKNELYREINRLKQEKSEMEKKIQSLDQKSNKDIQHTTHDGVEETVDEMQQHKDKRQQMKSKGDMIARLRQILDAISFRKRN